ncbi:MAG: RNA polymerase sigma factor [candidate division Zixibacteria bacterium]|nr:RNA polymerase sigma factor [candidate division Zixibacteria bacterium]
MRNNNTLFWKLIEKEYEMIKAYCYKLADTVENGDDLLQNSILKAQGNFGSLREIEKFRSWLYTITNNTYKANFRKPWWKKVLSISDEIETQAQTTNPTAFYEAKRKLNLAFDILSPDDRILVTLFELEGWKINEISKMIGKSEGSIKMRLSRARNKMRQKLSRSIQKNGNQSQAKKARELCFVSKPNKD